MNAVYLLRQRLGLTQHDLALFIGGKRSSLAHAENGSRSLNGDPSLHLLKLQQLQHGATVAIADEPVDIATQEHFKLQALNCRHKAATLKKRLVVMQERYSQACRLLHCVDQLEQTNGTELSAIQHRWIETQRYDAGKRKLQSNAGIQKRIALELAAMEAVAALYEKEGMDL